MDSKIEFEIYGIKCDNCDWRDDSIKFSEYEGYINKLCPLCNHNLLTQKDYNTCVRQYTLVKKR